MTPQQTIGANLALLRNKRGLTQDEIAEYLSVDRSMISYYESGKRDIPLHHLEKLADLYNLELTDLVEGNSESQEASVAFAFRTDGLGTDDLKSIADFQRVVKNYLKMQRIKNDEEQK